MKSLIVALVSLSSFVSQADIIKCTFTEPFIDTVYSMSQSTLTYSDFENHKTVLNNVSFQIKGAGVFELVQKGKVIQTLTLNFKGSNGMSDTIYPYEVKDNTDVMTANGGYGGCYSNYLKVSEPEQDGINK